MEIPTKALSSGLALPVYGLGLWGIGGKLDADTSQDRAGVEAIQRALEIGVRHIDAAEMYGNGHAEELLGRAIEGYDRSKLIISTKVSPQNQRYDDLHRALEASLGRLGTDYVDVYMLHRYPPMGVDIAETMRALDDLVTQGVVKHIGVSNLTPDRFAEAQKHTRNKLICNQVHYNVMVREAERTGILAQCQALDTFLVAWGPLQKGSLPEVPLMTELAQKYHKTPAQIALNWLISQRSVVVISKTSSLEHLQENLGALNWEMTVEDIERLRRDYPGQLSVSDRVPLNYRADVGP